MRVRYVVMLALTMAAAVARAGAPVEMTADEFQRWRTWVQLREAPALAKLSDAARRARVASELKVPVATLDAAIAKGDQWGAGIEERTAAAIRAELAGTPLEARLLEVTINSQTDQAVAFIKWQAGNPLDFDKEACLLAAAVNDAGHIVKILAIWAVNANNTTVFSAKVGRPAFEKIQKARIPSFASTRYIKMFEDVKRGPQG